MSTDQIYLSWQGTMTGPHSFEEVQRMTAAGTIHSLYKVQVSGQWMLLRDFLAEQESTQQVPAPQPVPEPPVHTPEVVSEPVQPSQAPLIPAPQYVQPVQMGYPAPYGYPQQVVPVLVTPRTSGMAVTSMIMGILAIISFWGGLLFGPLAIIFGHVGLSTVDGSQGTIRGRGMAITGLVLGYLTAAGFLVLFILLKNGYDIDLP